MIQRSKGFTLVEIMVAMSIGLTLLSAMMTFWLALSKNSHKEIVKLELSQDYLEVMSYLRSTIGRAIFHPHCNHPEWLKYQMAKDDHYMADIVARTQKVILHSAMNDETFQITKNMVNARQQYPELMLGEYQLKTLEGSDLLEMVFLTPLNVQENIIQNSEELKGGRTGAVLATDCRNYTLGQYIKTTSGQYHLSTELAIDVVNLLNEQQYIHYYKVNRLLIYVIYDQSQYHLVYNFLDGSNHIRFSNVLGMKIAPLMKSSSQLLQLQLWIAEHRSNNIVHKDALIRALGL